MKNADISEVRDFLRTVLNVLEHDPNAVHHIACFFATQTARPEGDAEVDSGRVIWGCSECLPTELGQVAIKMAQFNMESASRENAAKVRAEEITDAVIARAKRDEHS